MSYRVTNNTGVNRQVYVGGGRHVLVRDGETKLLSMPPMAPFLVDKWRKANLLFEETDEQPPRASRTAETPDQRADVEIPSTWRTLPWNKRRSLAAKLTDEPVGDAEAADKAIEAEIDRREQVARRQAAREQAENSA